MSRVRVDDESRSPLPAYICIADAKAKSAEAEVLYSDEEKAFGERVKLKIESAYFRSSVYLEYRHKFIAISVYRPTRQDKVSAAVAALDEYAERSGIKKVSSSRGNTIYRIPKK